jgi:hypothetical protein
MCNVGNWKSWEAWYKPEGNWQNENKPGMSGTKIQTVGALKTIGSF